MDDVEKSFANAFGGAPHVVTRAPGRVNLIGEHTDYSGGLVLPMAIPQETVVALAWHPGEDVRATSADIAGGAIARFGLGREARRGDWTDYLQGTTVALRARGHEVGGFDLAVASDVPIGAGLSSSAALETALLRALRLAFSLELDDVEIAKVGRAAETDFVGAPIGIMDQMASSLATSDAALFLDTRTLAFERVPFPSEAELVVIDSGATHDHATGGYATRRAEVERATALLGVAELRDVDDAARTDRLPEPLRRRARHVVTENARVRDAVAAMRSGDLARLGALLDASHASLRDDFEVSVADVDRLVALAQADADVYGARMTGGGFGGAIVALARRGTAAAAAARIVAAYGPRGRVLVPREGTT